MRHRGERPPEASPPASIPDSFAGLRVLDVGAFDGFYSFLAEARGARRVLAIDNEQYVHWVRDRWKVKLEGGEGFDAIHALLGSGIEYQRTDAYALDNMGSASTSSSASASCTESRIHWGYSAFSSAGLPKAAGY